MIIKDDPQKNRISICFPDPEDFISYYPEMLIQNSLPYFLQLSLYTEDNIPNLFYEKRGVSLDEMIENNQCKKGSAVMDFLLSELELLKNDLSRYLIAEKTIMFEPNYIYYVAEDSKYPFKFICIPSKKLLSAPMSLDASPIRKFIDSINYTPKIKEDAMTFDLPKWPEPIPSYTAPDSSEKEEAPASNFKNSIYNSEVKKIDLQTRLLNIPLKVWLAITACQMAILASYFSFDMISENVLIFAEIAWLVIIYLMYIKFSKAIPLPEKIPNLGTEAPNNLQETYTPPSNEFYFRAVMQNGKMNIEPVVCEQTATSNFTVSVSPPSQSFSGNAPILKIKHNLTTQIINLNSEHTIITTNSFISKNPNFLPAEYSSASVTAITAFDDKDVLIAVTQKNSLYFIENLLRNNNILLNSRQIITFVRYNLNNGDEITIAGLYAYFSYQ